MPPRPAQTTKNPTKSSKLPYKSEPKSIPNPQTVPKSDLSDSNELKITNRAAATFDLNEPWCVTGEYLNEVEESSKLETEVSEIGDKIEEVPIKEEKKKQKEYEVFVGGLDRDAVEEDLYRVFCKIGEIVEVRLVKSRYSQKNKGFAFVRFATVEQAKKAAYELNYTQVRGKICEVTRNNDNETLHLGNICPTWTKDMLLERLSPYELENLEEVLLIEDPTDKRRNRGYAFLNFGTHMDAATACHKLQKGNLYFGTGVRADVAFAKSAVEPDEEIMAQVKSVFLDHLPPSWDEEQVHEHFKKFGIIDNIELARNMLSAKRNDFGFISFKTREAALSCIDAVNRDGIGEGARKVLLKASLRKPLQRRMPSTTFGSGRGYSGHSYDDWSSRSRGIDRSYSSRPGRTVESFDRDRDRGRGSDSSREFNSYSRYSTGGVYKEDISPVDKYGSQYRREPFRQGHATETARSRSRDPYSESSSYSRHSLRHYEDIPASRSRVSSRGQYDDDLYGPQYVYYESVSPDPYNYPAPSRMKRPYPSLDDDQLVSRPLTRRARSGEYDLEMDAYPVQGISSYEKYSRKSPELDDYYEYDSKVYASRYLPDTKVYASRYMSGSGVASRAYHD